MKKINNHWEWVETWSPEFLTGKIQGEEVRIPHNVKQMPLHYSDSSAYQMVSGYRKVIHFDNSQKNKRHFLQFDGAAHIATVYFNGKELLTHKCGYTSFRVEITDEIEYGKDNVIAVKLDSTENPAIPPFGFVIDYLTYGGIYRDVYLDERNPFYIQDVFVKTPDLKHVDVVIQTDGPYDHEMMDVSILDENHQKIAEKILPASVSEFHFDCPKAKSWDIDHPNLYTLRAEIVCKSRVLDRKEVTFGFRTVEFDQNYFYLNGKRVFIRGLNRHQCFPYIGYAASDSLQVEDARILKEELGVNAVRTSHYPQSQAFIDACDRLGLLVFTEIPGWQHLGDEKWKQQAIENTKEMVLQYRNHPSIFLWGVRINESQDDDALYQATNDTAHKLDPTRPTSGVRYLDHSSLLEDVYGYNDFSHAGNNSGAKKKKEVTKDVDHPLLITEANGHMFPTKSFDSWQKREEHALRHAKVLNDAVNDGSHAGCFQWCMFDYATHKDFGSGDRICYHGVLDSFRNPKPAAYVYAAEGEAGDVLETSCSMDIGDYPAGHIDSFYVFTNADEVKLFKNGDYVNTFTSEGWNGLKHGPVKIDDFIGKLLEEKEGFDQKKAALVRDCMNAASKYGLSALPVLYKLKFAQAMVQYKISFEQAYQLYGKYVGNWGGDAVEWKLEGWKNGEKVKEITKAASSSLHIDAIPSGVLLHEGDTYDMAAIRIQIKDSYGNIASYAQLPLHFEAEGPIQLAGSAETCAEGGMCGTYIKTIGKAGNAFLHISAPGLNPVTISFTVEGEETL